MRAMVLDKPGQPLQLRDVPKPKPGRGQLLVRISTCAVCRTDLHVVDGELSDPKLPLILGHQIVGHVEEIGEENSNFAIGDRVGIPWLAWTDGDCAYCRSGRENLCDNARFTGYTIDGGYAEFTVADARYCFHLPARYDDVAVAPLRCAGLTGSRSHEHGNLSIDASQHCAGPVSRRKTQCNRSADSRRMTGRLKSPVAPSV